MKEITRREFLWISGGTVAGFALSGALGIDIRPVQASVSGLRILHAKQTTTICPYCSVSCGIIVHTSGGKVINTEGDPDHPINEGALCSKGMSVYQLSHNNVRPTKPLYREPFETEWKEVSWDFALDKIARRIWETRGKTFEIQNKDGQIVHRTLGMAFLGGMIKYILDNNRYFEEYVREYTNASFLISPDFRMPGETDGIFSGFAGARTDEGYVDGKYDKVTWSYQKDANGLPLKDPTLKNPNRVFQLLKKHYSRYTPEVVLQITGTPVDKLLPVYEAYSQTGKPDKSGTVLYAMGWTQHTVGTQNLRAMCIVQLLPGNMGMAGGGVNALRGESNVQGSTGQGPLYNTLPGYLKTPKSSQQNYKDYLAACTPVSSDPMSANWWRNYPKYMASLPREFYGTDVSLADAYTYLPKMEDRIIIPGS